ncbi:hypothetical protein J0A67_16260 [Algoriphagus aestuariicola]|uniref:Uncharacterized protein n=1 Tax=Algoriphagus aestuariicola TaxID=1852016 RepID=A0ABS3BSZ4_9BACT|nr:hypothetical protein [Algoriphagus aestuariicola]MBN7802428.1 hypothetical protein [Algoriphagus aestuariicola]
MRQQKIRGHRRRHKHIEEWRLKNLDLRLDLIQKYNGDHIDIVVHPWCDISIIDSAIPEPKGKTKYLMLSGLIDIYDSWKKQLDKIGQSYYLKIWLYEPRFSKSQVVCAVGDKISYYENIFFKSDNIARLEPNNFGPIKSRIENLNWDWRVDEDHFDNNEVGEPGLYSTLADFEESKKWFTRTLRKPHRTTKIDETTELYSFKRGCIWLGGQK